MGSFGKRVKRDANDSDSSVAVVDWEEVGVVAAGSIICSAGIWTVVEDIVALSRQNELGRFC